MERYYSFWRRLGAGILDGLVLLPISFLAAKLINPENPYSSFTWTVVQSSFFILYNVLFTGLGGQTIGKILLGIKVLDINEKEVIGIKRAFIRDAFPIILEVAGLLILGLQISGQITSDRIGSLAENVISNAWTWWFIAELITMFLNPKRRAIHDFLACSVVISLKGLKFDKLDEELEAQRLTSQK
jgi:uncharacterized RDD family membrane protein YckC